MTLVPLFALLILLLLAVYLAYILYTRHAAQKSGLPPPPWRSFIPFLSSRSSSSHDTNYPTPRSRGVSGWFSDTWARIRNRRTARGAYEEPLEAGRGGARDVDEAWDDRMGGIEPDGAYGYGGHGHGHGQQGAGAGGGGGGYAGYYEEQELGLQSGGGSGRREYEDGSYGGAGAGVPSAGLGVKHEEEHDEPERGRSRSRDPPEPRAGLTVGGPVAENPFGDQAEAPSLRDVSPRPAEGARDGDRSKSRSRSRSREDAGKGGSQGSAHVQGHGQDGRSVFRESL
ncbi:hypothetical protein FQN53_003731 [Emmonsiellopsis sp. PD_33]|nr:hypothetical protein FQN53_003731 [Emmonsiellopsis sp. PD_33]